MRIGKHSSEGQKIKELKEIIKLKDEEIRNAKSKCAKNFQSIMELCFINNYNNQYSKLHKIHEIASNAHFDLLEDLTFKNRKIELLPLTKVNK